ncbi:unnamed protein product [Chironomus riparius]|uniref:CHK kinase-like domain-containing protein n=1 Tax=Chironomus riparius TaxID=315576 RepID=A0A9N9RT02_9DIPT|nr:unnamed protein product [Chironomus riparius]
MDETKVINKSSLPNKVYEKVLNEIIENNLGKSSDEFKIICSAGSENGDGYVGEMYRIRVVDKETNEDKLNLIVKVPPENPVRRDQMFIKANVIFEREADFYDNVYPTYTKFQEDKGIDVEKEGFHEVPICYKTLTEEPYEGIFMEDLKASGFDMFDLRKDLTKDHVFLVMKALAKMHAIFYSIKDQNPEWTVKYKTQKDLFILMTEKGKSPMDPWFESMKKQALKVINESENTDMVEKINKLLNNKFNKLIENCFDLEKAEPYATLCHGDCWNNNMLFRFDDNEMPLELKFVDFQVIRYVSPVCDLVYYIFCGTTKELRDEHYQDFLNVYYEELTSYIRRLGSDPEKLFPRKAFEHHLKVFGHFGLLMALMTLPIFTSDSKEAPNMDELAEQFVKMGESSEVDENAFHFTKIRNQNRYDARILGVCNDMVELGYV